MELIFYRGKMIQKHGMGFWELNDLWKWKGWFGTEGNDD